VACPLCGDRRLELIESLSCETIRRVYREVLSIEIEVGNVRDFQYLRCTACDTRFFEPLHCGSPAFYEKLQAFPWYYLEEKSEYRLACKLIRAGSSVIEIGCGSGVFSTFLPPGCRYRGVEYNVEAVRRARLRGLDVDQISIDEIALSLKAQFDVVAAFQVLEHVQSPARFLDSAVKLLKPGGMLIIAVPSEDSFMGDEVNNVLNVPPHHVTRWTDTALRNIADVTGLQLVHLEHETLSDMHVRPFAKAQVWRLLRRKLGIPVSMVSRTAGQLWARALVRALSLSIEVRARRGDRRQFGHSVLAAYRKR
jgi:2-polyprenyl-3-methyl-5-hydroxy-6-metoxy-1,4-benzoquinol methylase